MKHMIHTLLCSISLSTDRESEIESFVRSTLIDLTLLFDTQDMSSQEASGSPFKVRLGKERVPPVGEGFIFASKINTLSRRRTKQYIDRVRQSEIEEKRAIVRSRKQALEEEAVAKRVRDQQYLDRKKADAAKLKESLRELARLNARKRGFDLDNFSYKRDANLTVDPYGFGEK